MNIVVISGKIISEIDFQFIYSKDKKEQHISIAKFDLQLDNNSIVKVIAYDENADYIYQNQIKYIYAEGNIYGNMKIESFEYINLLYILFI